MIPSEAEATLDIRALPDENIAKFYAEMAKVINDPEVKIVPLPATRPPSPATRLDTEMYRVLEQVSKQMYPGVTVIPSMSTGASDKAQLRAKGQQSYGIGPAGTREDATNFGAHSDVERLAGVVDLSVRRVCLERGGPDRSSSALRRSELPGRSPAAMFAY